MNKNEFNFIKKEQKQDIEQTRKSLTYWQDVWRRLKKNKMSMVGLVVVVLVVLFATIGPLFTPFSFEDQDNELSNLPPRLDVYEIAEGRYIFRTEQYDLIEFDEDGRVTDVLDQVNQDEDNKIYKYSYVLERGYGTEYSISDEENAYYGVEGGAYPLPTDVVLDETVYYSENWGIALQDREAASGDNEVVIVYVHPDSVFIQEYTVITGKDIDLVGVILDQFIFADYFKYEGTDIIDYYTIKSDRGARNIVRDMEKTHTLDNDEEVLKGQLTEIRVFGDLITLNFGDAKPEEYADVDFLFYYGEDVITEITKTIGNKLYPWGTDGLGRDTLTRVMYGTRISLLVALIATVVNLLIGITYGSISGYNGGNVDNIMMRIVDIINSVPLTLYVILLMVVLRDITWQVGTTVLFDGSDGFTTIIIALGSVYWVGMARLVRGQILGLKEQEYVLAARTIGVSNRKIIARHLIPNALGPIIVSMTMMIPSAIFTEAFLSFIGIGVSAPQASLGTLASDALGAITRYTYQLVFPSLAIAITILGFNFLGDGLRDALDPRLRKG